MNDQMNGPLKLDRVKAARAYLSDEALIGQSPVLDRSDIEQLGAMLYQLSNRPQGRNSTPPDVTNDLTRWAALHTDALMSVLLDRVQKPIDTTTQIHPDSRIGVASPQAPPPLSPLPEQPPPPPLAPRPMRVGNNEKRVTLKAGGWTCHEDIEAQNVPVCWENGGKWVTLEDAYDQLTEVPRAPTLDELVAVELGRPVVPAPPPPPPEPYTVRDLRALLEGLPGDAEVVARFNSRCDRFTVRSASVDREINPHGIVFLNDE